MREPTRHECVVLLAGEGVSTRMVYHALRTALPSSVRLEAIVERPVRKQQLLARRVRRLGVMPVVGQVLFAGVATPLLRLRARARLHRIVGEHGLDDAPLPPSVHRVASANSTEARELLQTLAPTVVVVNGTRILRKEILASVPAPFINMHAGITPAYRGVHGGYWALADGRPDLVGTTVHRVDEGIDTGAVIAQTRFQITRDDCFCTYPYLHTAAGLPLLIAAVNAALSGTLSSSATQPTLPSVLRYHPTLWGYLARRVSRQVR